MVDALLSPLSAWSRGRIGRGFLNGLFGRTLDPSFPDRLPLKRQPPPLDHLRQLRRRRALAKRRPNGVPAASIEPSAMAVPRRWRYFRTAGSSLGQEPPDGWNGWRDGVHKGPARSFPRRRHCRHHHHPRPRTEGPARRRLVGQIDTARPGVSSAIVLSFIYLGIYWNNHHHLLQAATHVSGAVLWANLPHPFLAIADSPRLSPSWMRQTTSPG